MQKIFIYGCALMCSLPAFAQQTVPVGDSMARVVIKFPFKSEQVLCAPIRKDACSVLVFNTKKEDSPKRNYILGYRVAITLSSPASSIPVWNVHAETSRYKLFDDGTVEDDGSFVKNVSVSSKSEANLSLLLGDNLTARAEISPASVELNNAVSLLPKVPVHEDGS